jgi:prepilin-type processing-associated H-X9-DG protein/prepilin-type N-terminal cleavage/methylation domain-containing protein
VPSPKLRLSVLDRQESPAFTLLELLAVCAVLGLLACFTLPAITNAFMVANRAKCASNLRQIGQALLTYAAEHDTQLPVTSHNTGDSRFFINGQWINTIEASWIYVLAPYLDNVDEVLKLNATSYILNDIVFDDEAYGSLLRLPYPSRTLLAFISNRPVSRTWDHAHCAQWNTWGALNDDIAPDRHRTGSRSTNRLRGTSNYLYADGHVATIPATEMKRLIDSGTNPAAVPLSPPP